MRAEGYSIEEIARKTNQLRNTNRLNDYINDPEGLARVKNRNILKYGNEDGPTAEYLFEKYGSWEKVIEKSMSANPGMDACCGLYDKIATCFDNSYMALYMDRCDCNYKSFQYNFGIYRSKEISSKEFI